MVPSSTTASVASSSKDLKNTPEYLSVAAPLHSSGPILDSPRPSSGLQRFSTLQFSFQDLKAKRQQRLSRLQFTGYKHGNVKLKRSLKYCFLLKKEKL